MVPVLDRIQDDDTDELADRTILNVFRRTDDKVLKTGEIAEELPISHDWTSKRLNRLESKGRVHSKSAGRGRVWWLDDSEPSVPLSEGIEDIMWYATAANEVSTTSLLTGGGMFIVAGMLLIPIFLTGIYPNYLNPIPVTTEHIATTAMIAAVVAGLLLVVGGGFRLISVWIQKHYSLE